MTSIRSANRLLLIGWTILIPGLAQAQPSSQTLAARTDALFTEWNGPGRPGAAVGVVHGGKLIYAKGFGEADVETGARIGPETIFHVASISKQFTAYGIVLLAQEGKLSLDDAIHKYLPEVPDFGQNIRIRHLIHHTSGLRDQWTLLGMAGWQLNDVITREHVFNLVTRQRALNYAPGAEYAYSNTGYTLLAEIVARVSKQPFREWMQQRIFGPLGMKNTLFYDDQDRIVRNRAYSFHRSDDPRSDDPRSDDLRVGTYKKSILSYGNAGATSLFTTVTDLAQWIANYREPKVGTKATITQMLERGRLNNGDTLPYAFALVHGTHKGLAYYGHSGSDAGFQTRISYFPKEDYGFIVLFNQAETNPAAKVLELADIYLTPAQPKKAPETSGTSKKPAPSEASFKPVLADYVGRYYSPELETIYSIRAQNDSLQLVHIHHGTVSLKPAAPDRFTVSWWFVQNVEAVRNPQHAVMGLRFSNGRVRNLWLMRLPDDFGETKPPITSGK